MGKAISDKNKKFVWILVPSLVALSIMFLVDNVIYPDYFWKSIIKITLFAGCVVLYFFTCKENVIKESFHFKKKAFLLCSIIALIGFCIIIGGYAIISNFIDPTDITDSLLSQGNIGKDNFVWVSLYISLVNSCLEELFFRGFLFMEIKKLGYRKLGYIISALLFALYHVGVVINWFNIWIFLLVIALLYIAGVILNKTAEFCESFFGSWIIHILANISINLIGFYLLGMI